VRIRQPIDASMGLLHEVMHHPVDPGYAEAAARPAEQLTEPARVRRTTGYLLVALALGLAIASAIVTLRAPQPSAVASRAVLEQEIADRSSRAASLQASNEALSAEIATLQSDALGAANPGLFARLSELELLSGAVAVEGPGLVLELRDAEVADRGEPDLLSRVQDVDLQIVTNGLWAAGAEAIAINGHRLTTLTAIRSAGPAILVDLAPLVGPYTVEAIGDVRAMQTEFARSRAANHLAMITATYGIESSTRSEPELALPGAGGTTLRYATAPSADVASSVGPDQEGTP
jgi:uncharacterized protein YlxW (UPF0749 family)